jgi:hypothetical protein
MVKNAEKSLHEDATATPITELEEGSGPSVTPLTGVLKAGRYIGDPNRHHMHIGIAPDDHYKDGNNLRSKIGIIDRSHPDRYDQNRLMEVINTLNLRQNEPGAQACITWCQNH